MFVVDVFYGGREAEKPMLLAQSGCVRHGKSARGDWSKNYQSKILWAVRDLFRYLHETECVLSDITLGLPAFSIITFVEDIGNWEGDLVEMLHSNKQAYVQSALNVLSVKLQKGDKHEKSVLANNQI